MPNETLSDYDFHLPEHLIAQRPPEVRRSSKLFVLRKGEHQAEHRRFDALLENLKPGDALVINNTRVFRARLFGKKLGTGGSVEILLSRPEASGDWVCLANARSRIKPGLRVELGNAIAEFKYPLPDEPGAWVIGFSNDVFQIADKLGELPLPPYISRAPDESDLERYQTVFSNPMERGAVAAPTAGLHFDDDLLEQIRAMDVRIVEVTLHVGPGTFLPIRTNDLDAHQMHVERWSISNDAARVLNQTRAMGGRIVAVGTTSVRTLESAIRENGSGTFTETSGLTRLFIRPGFRFQVVDALVTNFHQPKTTLLMLVAAAIGRERLLHAYNEAIANEYRFFSYGDACYFEIEDFAK